MNCGISVGGRIIVCILCSNMLTLPKLFIQSCSSVLLQSAFQKELQTIFNVLVYTKNQT